MLWNCMYLLHSISDRCTA